MYSHPCTLSPHETPFLDLPDQTLTALFVTASVRKCMQLSCRMQAGYMQKRVPGTPAGALTTTSISHPSDQLLDTQQTSIDSYSSRA